MAHAGIDCGSTLLKGFWLVGNTFRFVTVDGRSSSVDDMVSLMRTDGVGKVRVTGTGASSFTPPGVQIVSATDVVEDEIKLQAQGIRLLMGRTAPAPKKMLVASIGTGVSYSRVSGAKISRSPLGSAHGGGTIMGLARLVGVTDFTALAALAAKGTAPDQLVKHKLPETAGTPVGELIISHFGPSDRLEDTCAGIFSFAAASIFKDLAVLTAIPLVSPKEIVVIGSVGRCQVFQDQLRKFAPHFKKGVRLHFPADGEYAAAVGAWHALATGSK